MATIVDHDVVVIPDGRSLRLTGEDDILWSGVASKIQKIVEVFDALSLYPQFFNLKCRIYSERLKKLLPSPNNGRLECLSALAHRPLIPWSKFDESVIERIREANYEENDSVFKQILDSWLTSTINKAMLIIVVEYDAWSLRTPARDVLIKYLLEILWPNSAATRDLFRKYFISFSDVRVRHFRDSLARHYREAFKSKTVINSNFLRIRSKQSSLNVSINELLNGFKESSGGNSPSSSQSTTSFIFSNPFLAVTQNSIVFDGLGRVTSSASKNLPTQILETTNALTPERIHNDLNHVFRADKAPAQKNLTMP